MSKTAVIFPGQGAQFIGMGQDVAAAHPVAAEIFREADALIGFDLSRICFEDPDGRLNTTDIQQPAIFVTSVAIFRAAEAVGALRREDLAGLGGLSLGEYTALHIAGALSFADALRLVKRRGELMQQASEATHGGMVSVIGLDEPKVNELCAAVADHGRVVPANFNCPGQIVVSGDQSACEAVLARVEDVGGKAVPLKVAGAFHSPLMQIAADGLAEELKSVEFAPLQTPVVCNVDGAYHHSVEATRSALYQHVIHPVRWQSCVERLIADGVSTFVEVGPGRVLTGLMRKINRSVKAASMGKAADIVAAGESQ